MGTDPPASANRDPPGEVRDDRIHVLVVDEDPAVADAVSTAVERAESETDVVVVTAPTVEEALAVVEARAIDCVVTDYALPAGDGLALLEALRDRYPHLPVVLFTGEGSERVASDAIRAGVTDYVRKSAGTATLADRVVEAVETYRKRRRRARVERIDAVFREIDRTLARASTREGIESAVCEVLADSDTYRFAWIGEFDPENDEIRPSAAAGVEDGYLDEIEITVDEEPTGQGPTGRAVRTREVQVMQDIPTDPAFEPWRDDALERGYRSSAAVPLTFDGELHAVLGVYSDRRYAFDGPERDLLRDLGETIGHALDAVAVREQLRREKERFRLLVDEVEDYAIYLLDDEGRVTSWNEGAATIEGHDEAEILGEHFSTFYPEDAREVGAPAEALATAREEGSYESEGRRVRADCSRFWASVTITALHDENGEVWGFTKVTRDVTERKEREEQLRERERELERQNERLEKFASIVSHDLRSPLEAANGHVELLAAGQDPEAHVEGLREVLDRMADLIEDVLTLARVGDAIGDTRSVDVGSVATRAWVSAGDETARLGVENGVGSVDADGSRLQQLLENLFRNAIEHAGPEVTVRVGPLEDGDGFYVADDGPGIPRQDRDAVFEEGYSTGEDGTGFGLAIVEEIATAHGWSVALAGSRDGGARFEFHTGDERRSGNA